MPFHHRRISYNDFLTSCFTLFNKQNEHFTGGKQCVNPSVSKTRAGKNLGELCLFKSQGDAKSLKPALSPGQEADLGITFQGQLRQLNKTILLKAEEICKKFNASSFLHLPTLQNETNLNPPVSKLIVAALVLGILLCPQVLWAHTGEVLKDEIDKVEKLFTGGYMRLGLLGVCGFAAVYGVVKQSGWMFVSGILGCVFAYFMKDWVIKTFTAVI